MLMTGPSVRCDGVSGGDRDRWRGPSQDAQGVGISTSQAIVPDGDSELTTNDTATLSLLGDTDLTIADTDEDIRGRTVKDKDGEDIGQVDDLLIDEDDRKVRFMRVESGGFLGMGETKVFIPIDAITMITDIEVRINQSHEHVARAPRYDPQLVADRTYLGDLYTYYGFSSD
jgi:sporulation protein YlmC with PRC-barrel domain